MMIRILRFPGTNRSIRFAARSLSGASPSSTGVENHPNFVEVPALPFVGSLFSPFSKTPKMQEENLINWWRKVNAKYGEFFSFGFPGLGDGTKGTCIVLRDHNEYLKVLKHEGTYPSGLVQTEWPVIDWMNRKKFGSVGFMGRGSEWKRIRSFLQKDLLSPTSAKEYLPAIIKGAAKNSPNAAKFAADNNLNRFLNYCAMDMFTGVFLGTEEGIEEEEYHTFVENGVTALSEIFAMMRDPKELVAHAIGFETARVKRFYALMDSVDEIARKRMGWFLGRMQRGELSEDEKNSYFAKSVERQKDSDVSVEELFEIGMLLLVASVDTTASKTAWNILQLALHPKFQEDLYQQIHKAVEEEGGLTPAVLDRGRVSLLHCLVRETHRCTPPTLFDLTKKIEGPIVVHGKEFPPGSTFIFDSASKQLDPNLVDGDPLTFKPERWLSENVQARKGTPAAVLDHLFYSGPFSQGARRCPGSRVAFLEIQALVAQLLLDWKIEGPAESLHWKDVRGTVGTFFTPAFPKGIRFVPR